MKPNSSSLLLLLGAILVAPLSGCLLSHSNHSVIRQDEPLLQLAFESEKARSVFESKVQKRKQEDEAHASFAIPFIVGLKKSVSTSENAIRNDMATMMDINGDRFLSEREVSFETKD